jgi:hypothetical protein
MMLSALAFLGSQCSGSKAVDYPCLPACLPACRDFIQVFSTCWVVQLPPSSWHQIRLSAGWLEASAGGPPAALTAPTCTTVGDLSGPFKGLACSSPVACQDRPSSPWQQPLGTVTGTSSQPPPPPAALRSHSQHGIPQLLPAGGPLTISSSWCCNPQFKLVVSSSANMVICLAQRDLHVSVLAGSHIVCRRV